MVNISQIKLQKNRFKKNSKINFLKFGQAGLNIKKGSRLELIHITFLKKIFKIFLKKKKNNLFKPTKKIWFYLCPNSIIQKKSKNSRMGKGKGSFERKIIRMRFNQIIAEFEGININKLKNFKLQINKKLNIKINIIYKVISPLKIWVKTNKYYYFYKKYLN